MLRLVFLIIKPMLVLLLTNWLVLFSMSINVADEEDDQEENSSCRV